MYKNNKRFSRFGRAGGGLSRLNLRDKVRSQLYRLKKRQGYVIEKSGEPEGDKTYVVVYESETKNGFGTGVVFKGTERECEKLCDELNAIIKERRDGIREQD